MRRSGPTRFTQLGAQQGRFDARGERRSALTYQLLAILAMMNSGRLKRDQSGEALEMIYDDVWKQLRLARHRIPARAMRTMALAPSEGQMMV